MDIIYQYMNKRKLLILAILAIFCVGMVMGAASASHTYHKKGFKFKVSNSQYKKIKYVKKHSHASPSKMAKHKVFFKVKTNKVYVYKSGYKTVRKPVYASIETHRSGKYYVTYDFYVNGIGYVKFGGKL